MKSTRRDLFTFLASIPFLGLAVLSKKDDAPNPNKCSLSWVRETQYGTTVPKWKTLYYTTKDNVKVSYIGKGQEFPTISAWMEGTNTSGADYIQLHRGDVIS